MRAPQLPGQLLKVGRLSPATLLAPRVCAALFAAVPLPSVVPNADDEPAAAPTTRHRVARAATALDAHSLARPTTLFSPPPTGRLSLALRQLRGLPACTPRKGTRARTANPGSHLPSGKALPASLKQTLAAPRVQVHDRLPVGGLLFVSKGGLLLESAWALPDSARPELVEGRPSTPLRCAQDNRLALRPWTSRTLH